jgi:hypothetical protein
MFNFNNKKLKEGNMKRVSIVIVALLLFSLVAYGQGGWTDDGTVVRLTTDSDSVGIGTATPTCKLDVLGNINIGNSNVFQIGGDDFIKSWASNYALAIGKNTGPDKQGSTYIGEEAGRFNTGIRLTAVGWQAGRWNKEDEVTAIGYRAGHNNNGNGALTAVGSDAGYENSGGYLTAVGYRAGNSNTGQYVTSIGSQAGINNQGGQVAVIGDWAGYNNTGHYLTATGHSAGNANQGGGVTVTGASAGTSNTGDNLTATGASAARTNAGRDVTVTGYMAGDYNKGDYLTAAGSSAGYSNQGSRVTAMGYRAAYYNTGSNLCGSGYEALRSNTGDNVVAIGYEAGKNNTTSNIFILKQNNVNTTPLIYGDFSTGNVGIGTSPTEKLHVNGTVRMSGFKLTTGAANGYVLTSDSNGVGTWQLGGGGGASLWSQNGSDIYYNTGKVGIGVTNPQSELTVNGVITTKEMKVKLTGWPDFVFADNYKLMPLNKLERYIKREKSLPGIPESKEVTKEGVNVGELQAKLLEKVEELTLYVITQNKELTELKKEVGDLKKENRELRKKISARDK